MTPLLIGGIVVLGSVAVYELYEKVIKKPGDGRADVAAPADASATVVATAPSSPSPRAPGGRPGRPGAPGTGTRPAGAKTGMDPRFLAAHPEWAGWRRGMPPPPGKPSPPALRQMAQHAATTTPIVNGAPVMSGGAAKDLAAAIAWGGAASIDPSMVRRFQQSQGLNPDGKFGPDTASALAVALQGLGIPMPNVVPAGHVAPPMAPAAPRADHNISG